MSDRIDDVAKIRIAVMVDNLSVARWQADALRTLAADHEFTVYNCTNSRSSPRHARHALYYLLNLWAIRNPLTRSVPLPPNLDVATVIDFESEYQGNWQLLPQSLLDQLGADAPSVVLKFGMGLLRVPADLSVPILSYHHGDPSRFRGRPAGFYELVEGCGRLGQIVQILSDKLDAGTVVAFAETKVHRHSYRATLIEAFRISPMLLRPAIANALAGRTIPLSKGQVYRLPSNREVAKFCADRARDMAARTLYGGFVAKRWQVAEAFVEFDDPIALCQRFPAVDAWQLLPIPAGYGFIADPFYHPYGDGILVEGLRRATGKGEILHLTADRVERLEFGEGHCSYPSTLSAAGRHYVIPETAAGARASLYHLSGNGVVAVSGFEIDGRPRLLDPTMLHHDDNYYLFANRADEGPSLLRLWCGQSLAGRFTEHPCSPVRISPAGSRMAGNFVVRGSSLFRWGQDLTGGYGDGVFLFAVERLSLQEYREAQCCALKFEHVRGPHTVNIRDGRVLFDFYRNKISLLAGIQRLNGLREARKH